ncbi:MAG: class I SAM-dependent methyltransferase [Acidimicrobiales bacterium]
MEPTDTLPPPNHHADYPGLAGLRGVIAAASMAFGRDPMAAVARDLVHLQPDDRLLDVGCGPGAATRHAASLGLEVIGVDPLPTMLRTARLCEPRGRVDWRLGAAEALPVDDGWATVAWTLASVHHWPDVEAGVREVHRALRSGGRFVAIERRIADTAATGLGSHGWTPPQAASFAAIAEGAGFVEVRVVERPAGEGSVLAVVAERRASAMIVG